MKTEGSHAQYGFTCTPFWKRRNKGTQSRLLVAEGDRKEARGAMRGDGSGSTLWRGWCLPSYTMCPNE